MMAAPVKIVTERLISTRASSGRSSRQVSVRHLHGGFAPYVSAPTYVSPSTFHSGCPYNDYPRGLGSGVMTPKMDALLSRLASRGTGSRTEADIQSDVKLLLLTANLDLGDEDLDVRLETQAGQQRRIDVEVGYAVIETKKDLRRAGILSDAVDQLNGYVDHRTATTGQRYVGILTDGHDWHLYTLGRDGALVHASAFELRSVDDGEGLVSWLSTVLATTHNVSATAEEIDRRFGATSPAHQLDMIALRDLWEVNAADGELRLKKELWGKLLHTALGEAFADDVALFIEHTYLVITAELIAHEVLGVDITTIDPRDLVTGRAFTQAGVHGVVESDFFDWPADLPGGDKIVRAIARRVAQIDWSTTRHDLLKHLYESVITTDQRHSLGEYYTPDWLAEAVVEAVVEEPASQRVLDPSCGSGTFVFHAVRRAVDALEADGVPNGEALTHVTSHVLGMDVHPVAVTLARVTYLLALGTERLSGDRPEISVPVYLGDSVQWQITHSIYNQDGLTIPTDDGKALFSSELFFPATALADPVRFERLVSELIDRATTRDRGARPLPGIKQILNKFGLSEADQETVTGTFRELCDLHDNHRNHIWGYYIRNLARPLWLTREDGKVDRIVGNPPWLSYRFMDERTKKVFRERSLARNIWAGGHVATQQDLAAYFLVRACELYLRDGGRFGMVLPLATLSRKPTEGFRRAVWGVAGVAQFGAAWDLDKVRPHIFPVPACVIAGAYRSTAEPGVALALKGPTEKWSGKALSGTTWAAAQEFLVRTRVATPAGTTAAGARSPYGASFIQGAIVVPRVLHVVERVQSVGGLGLPSGQVHVRSVRSSLEKGVWKELPSRGPVPVEEAFVHPMHLGSTLAPYRMLEPWQAVLPIDPATSRVLDIGDPELERYPRAAEWWRESSRLWDQHGKGTMTLREQIDYMSKLRRQLPAAPIRVVYTKSGTRLAAAVITDPAAIIDHALYWGAVATLDEARYLEAVLNASVTQRLVEPLQSRGQLGARHFDMYVWQLAIPRFRESDGLHAELSELAARAEGVARAVVLPAGVGFQKARKEVREALARDGVAAEIEHAVAKLLGVEAPSDGS